MDRYALLLSSGPAELDLTGHGFQTALDLDRHEYAVDVYFVGSATRLPAELPRKSGHPVYEEFSEVTDRGLVAGACGFCASALGTVADCEAAGIPVLNSSDKHKPDLGALAEDGVRILTMGGGKH